MKIISEPSILAINNQESSIYVGKRQSIQVGATLDKNGNPIANIERIDIGLRLKVKPRITNDAKVMLDIVVEQEEANELSNTLQPISDKKEIITTVIVNNGENVILGGYIKNKSLNSVDKVPYFGEVPLLGTLFTHKSSMNDQVSLAIVLTPYIVTHEQSLMDLQEELKNLKVLQSLYYQNIIEKIQTNKVEYQQNTNNRFYSDIIDKIVDKN